MEENRKHIDELFREALGNYTETPPPAVWAKVEDRLDGGKGRPRMSRLWWGWVLVLLISVGGGTYAVKHYIQSRDNTSQATEAPKPSSGIMYPSAPYPSSNAAETTTLDKPVVADNPSASTPASFDPSGNPDPHTTDVASAPIASGATTSRPASSSSSNRSDNNGIAPRAANTLHTRSKSNSVVRSSGRRSNNRTNTTTAATRRQQNTNAASKPTRPQQTETTSHPAPKPSFASMPETQNTRPSVTGKPTTPGRIVVKEFKDYEPPVKNRSNSSQTYVASTADDAPYGDVVVRFPSAIKHEMEAAKQRPKITRAPETTGNPVATEAAPPPIYPRVSFDTTSNARKDDRGYTNHAPKQAPRFSPEIGLNAGYSFGLAKPAHGEVNISPYFQLNLGPKWAIRFNLAYRWGNVSSFNLAGGGNFYNITNQKVDSFSHLDTVGGGQVVLHHDYYSSQRYDSLNVGYTAGGRTWAVDLPINVGYKLRNGFSLFGGPVFTFGNAISISTSRHEVKNLFITDSVRNAVTPKNFAYFNNLFQPRAGNPYSNATSLTGQDNSFSMRMGYLFGLQYTHGRWQGEFSIQQHLTGFSGIDNPEIKKIYTQPYFRFTIGYQLWQPKRKTPTKPE